MKSVGGAQRRVAEAASRTEPDGYASAYIAAYNACETEQVPFEDSQGQLKPFHQDGSLPGAGELTMPW